MKILLAEDEPGIAAQVTEQLLRAGFTVEHARDGETASFRAETEAFDAIVLDLGLPRLDGLSVLRRLRSAGVGTPVVVLTARGSWVDRVRGIDDGADDYLPKPFHMEELLARLDAVLRRSGGHDTPVLCAGTVQLDLRRMIVTVASARVEFPPREFQLLRLLLHHKGRVLSQVAIEEHLYGTEREPDSNAIETLVKRVRRKLGVDIIQTRRGYGYLVDG